MNDVSTLQLSSEDITEFHSWVESGLPVTPPETHPYFEEIYRLDILPCLTFRNSEVKSGPLPLASSLQYPFLSPLSAVTAGVAWCTEQHSPLGVTGQHFQWESHR